MKRGEPIPQAIRALVVDRCDGICEARLPEVCSWLAVDIHHIKARSRGGSNNPGNLLVVCRECHEAIESKRPGTAGFRTHSWQDEGRRENDD